MTRRIVVQLPGRAALTAGGWCSPCEAEKLQAQQTALSAFAAATTEMPTLTGMEVPFTAVLAVEGTPTGDGRQFNEGSLRWDVLPMPLRWCEKDLGYHDGASVVGLIESVERVGTEIRATGYIDGTIEQGAEAIRRLRTGLLRGVSVDLDDVDLEIRIRAELLDPEDVEELGPTAASAPVDEDGRVTVYEMSMDDELAVVMDARLRGATLVDIPAFAEAYVTLETTDAPAGPVEPEVVPVESDDAEPPAETPASLAASAVPVRPPAAWLANPGLTGPTPVRATAEGRIFGHIASWNTCHTGLPGCTTAPRSATGYAWFRTGILIADDGTEHPVGRITMDTGHAGPRLTAAASIAHYDHTGAAVADVTAGEDQYGIWIAGALRPGLSEERLRALRAAPMSGDWRRIAGNLELCAVLAVNLPGFPVLQPRALVASGRTQSFRMPLLKAAQLTGPDPAPEAEPPSNLRLIHRALAVARFTR